jgi:hypothetical protein
MTIEEVGFDWDLQTSSHPEWQMGWRFDQSDIGSGVAAVLNDNIGNVYIRDTSGILKQHQRDYISPLRFQGWRVGEYTLPYKLGRCTTH